MRVLVLFGTSEGHTQKIAHFLSDRFSGQGHQVAMADVRDLPVDLDPVSHDLVIIAARSMLAPIRGPCSASCDGIAGPCS